MKTASLLALSALLTTGFAQDCNNPLLQTFGLTGLDQPVSGADLPFCADLRAGQTCCSVETVAQFQGLINEVQSAILNVAGTRDQNINNLRNTVLNNYDNAVDTLDDFDGALNTLQAAEPEVGNEIRNQLNTFQDIENRLDNIDDNDEFSNALQDYQRRRVTCLNTLLQIQTSAWCLACNPNYASLGVSDEGAIAFSAELNNTIVTNCLPFTERGNDFNALFQANQSLARVQNLILYMQNYTNSGNILPNLTLSDDVEISTDPTQRTNAIPEGCSGNVCVFQNENLFDDGVLNGTVAGNGAGVIGGADVVLADVGELTLPPTTTPTPTPTPNNTNTTIIDNSTDPTDLTVVDNSTTPEDGIDNITVVDNSTRLLQAPASWNPDLSQAGVPLAVVADPGQVTGLQGDGNAGNTNPGTDNTDTDDVNPGLSSIRLVASGVSMAAVLIGALIL